MMETQRSGYGVIVVTIRRQGAAFTGSGLTPHEALYRANLQARDAEPCAACYQLVGRSTVRLSRRALGLVLCFGCQERMRDGFYAESDPER